MMLAHKYWFYILLIYAIKILAFKFWNLVTSGFGEAISNLKKLHSSQRSRKFLCHEVLILD